MANRTEWEQLEGLGEGGQSQVFLVRRPTRAQERAASAREIAQSNVWGPIVAQDPNERIGGFADAVWRYSRPEAPSELGAMKVFKLSEAGAEAKQQAVERLKSEISVLRQNRPGLPELLDSNEAEGWIVTEFFPERTLEKHPGRYRGRAAVALRALRSLAETVALLHKEGIVHRDIKPANVFIRKDDQLILGDFGIAYVPNQADRVTLRNERVGPRDYMPQWGDLGVRLEKVQANFDVYMLGKLLWCMVSGRLKLPREYHKRTEYNLTELFPNEPDMHAINALLDKCVVEEPEQCLSSAQDLLMAVDAFLAMMSRGGQLLRDGVPRPCHVCGVGFYQPEVLGQNNPVGSMRFWISGSDTAHLGVRAFVCSNCGHVEFFKMSPG